MGFLRAGIYWPRSHKVSVNEVGVDSRSKSGKILP